MNPPPLSTTSCPRHPEEKNFTSFCPSCLFERLSVLDPNASNPSSSSTHRKSSASALKSIFFPELRRSKSFSASKHDASSSATLFEPQRKSCDVRIRTSLYNEPKIINNEANFENLPSEEQNADEIRVVDETNVSDEIVEEEEEEEIEELKSMKDHIDLDSSQLKKPKSSFWSAATVFSKKLQKWRQKQKEEKESKKPHHRKSVNKPPIGRRLGETQSEKEGEQREGERREGERRVEEINNLTVMVLVVEDGGVELRETSYWVRWMGFMDMSLWVFKKQVSLTKKKEASRHFCFCEKQ